MKILVVVDTQKDFVDGSLGTKEALAIVPNIVKKINQNKDNLIIVTYDTHYDNYLNTNEGKHLPVKHCIKGTDGHKLNEEVEKSLADVKSKIEIEKNTFGSYELVDIIKKYDNVDEIELIGLCTDICVIVNAMLLKTAFPEIDIIVDSNACAGVTVDSHNFALETMRMCQIEII